MGRSRLRRCAWLVLFVAIGGCSMAARPGEMVSNAYQVERRHPGSVSLKVTGASSASSWGPGSTKISDEAFTRALTDAVGRSQLFQRVVTSGPADYALHVQMQRLDPANLGATTEMHFVTLWKLTDGSTGRLLWEDVIATIGTVRYWDAPNAFTRTKLAMELAGKKAIERGTEEVSRLDLTRRP